MSCAALYLVVSAVIGAALLSAPKPAARTVPPRAPTYVADTPGSTTITTRQAPPGYEIVTGPQTVQTVIPVGWRVARSGGPGAMRATDPADAGRFVGFGGAPARDADLGTARVEDETSFAARTTDYRRITLNLATYAGHPAVEWEYRHEDGGGPQRVRALYWRVDGVEYFVSAAGPEPQWPRMKPVYDEMVANSRP